MSTVSHINYEVATETVAAEVRFWNAIGFWRLHTHTTKDHLWLADGDHLFIHLQRQPDAKPQPDTNNHVAIKPTRAFDEIVRNLEQLPEIIKAETAPTHWGSRRLFLRSPMGYLIELLEWEPPARWSPPPEAD